MSEDKLIIIDVQGFFVKNTFVLKELSIFQSDLEIKTFIIQPPFGYQNLSLKDKITVNWLHNNHHGLWWDDGKSSLRDVQEYLRVCLKGEEHNSNVFAKGLEKIKWIQNIIKKDFNVIDLDDLNCPNFENLYKANMNDSNEINVCDYHKMKKNFPNSFKCSEKNVILLKKFLLDYMKKENINKQ